MSTTEIRQIPLAIVGMACRLPGADDLDAFWQMLVEGRSAVADLPESRFDRDLYYDPRTGVRNKSYTFRGAIVSRDGLDFSQAPAAPALFREADSSHQLLCLVASEALRHARYDPCNLPTRNAGVYVGHTIGSDLPGDIQNVRGIEETLSCLRDLDLPELDVPQKDALCRSATAEIERNGPKREQGDSGLASHMVAGLISKSFGLNGPFMSVNAACASSLQALVIAGRALQRGQIEMALVGGASSCSRDWLVLFSQSTALSHTDSRPFDHHADGLIVAEAYVAVVVKTLERALADRDTIQAVIRGMGISADGRGKTLWAPRAEGQIAAIRRAYGPGVDVADVQYIEAHATATQLGDATEIASLRAVFEGRLPQGRKIPIASVKANIGHALEAAGLVGLVKAALCMQKGLIPRAINIETLNPKVDWANAPVAVPLESIPWPESAAGKPRRAAVNAFGIGGLNVHIVLDGAPDPRTPAVRPSAPRAPAEDAVAVIGIGSVLPGALDAAGFWDLLESPDVCHRASLRTNGSIAADLPWRRGLFVEGFQYDWRRHRIPPKEIEVADPLQFMVLEAADQALHDAGYDRKEFDRTRTGVIVGTEFTGEFGRQLAVALRLPCIERIVSRLLAEMGVAPARAEAIASDFAEAWHSQHPVLRDNTGSFSASSLAVRIAKTWNLMGCAAALDSGPTSGMSALSAAFDLLVCGDCDLMICAGAQRQFDLVTVDSRASEDHGSLRGPFDRSGTGFLRGEGAAVLLMKRLPDALRDGDRIHAVVRGVASAHDAARNTISQALDRSLELSGRLPNDLAMVLSDACGIPEVDEGVARAVAASRSVTGRSYPLPLGSVIGQIGHLGGASSLASLVAAILAFRNRLVPAASEIVDPIPTLRRNPLLRACTHESIPLRNGHPQLPSLSAVLSHGLGLAYATVLEAAK
jgi:acyl transferase domain-containing protein